MELVVGVAIGVLAMVFLGSLLALFLVCRHRYCYATDRDQDSKPILRYSKGRKIQLQCGDSVDGSADEYDLEDVLQLGPNIGRLLREQDWSINEVGPVPHCLKILKLCHQVADKLSGISLQKLHAEKDEIVEEICASTKRLAPRVDDLVHSMYPPIDLALLEARAAALVFATRNLSLIFHTTSIPSLSGQDDSVNQAFDEMDFHLTVLRNSIGQVLWTGYGDGEDGPGDVTKVILEPANNPDNIASPSSSTQAFGLTNQMALADAEGASQQRQCVEKVGSNSARKLESSAPMETVAESEQLAKESLAREDNAGNHTASYSPASINLPNLGDRGCKPSCSSWTSNYLPPKQRELELCELNPDKNNCLNKIIADDCDAVSGKSNAFKTDDFGGSTSGFQKRPIVADSQSGPIVADSQSVRALKSQIRGSGRNSCASVTSSSPGSISMTTYAAPCVRPPPPSPFNSKLTSPSAPNSPPPALGNPRHDSFPCSPARKGEVSAKSIAGPSLQEIANGVVRKGGGLWSLSGTPGDRAMSDDNNNNCRPLLGQKFSGSGSLIDGRNRGVLDSGDNLFGSDKSNFICRDNRLAFHDSSDDKRGHVGGNIRGHSGDSDNTDCNCTASPSHHSVFSHRDHDTKGKTSPLNFRNCDDDDGLSSAPASRQRRKKTQGSGAGSPAGELPVTVGFRAKIPANNCNGAPHRLRVHPPGVPLEQQGGRPDSD